MWTGEAINRLTDLQDALNVAIEAMRSRLDGEWEVANVVDEVVDGHKVQNFSVRCSRCYEGLTYIGTPDDSPIGTKYCPRCGARMKNGGTNER